MLTILLLSLATDAGDLARPIDLYAMTLEQARRLHGYRVEVVLEAGCPVDVGDGYTMVGGYEKEDGIERAVRLRGEFHDIEPGDVVTTEGVLRVIEHKEATVNGVKVPAWVEIRVEQPIQKPHQ
jgi:hypothetical protein